MLRIDFPGYDDDRFEPISWDEFFKKFDEEGLAMLYQDKTADGKVSRFYKFVSRDTIEEKTDKSAEHHPHRCGALKRY